MTEEFKRTENILYEYKNFETLNKIAMARISMLENDILFQDISYEEKTEQTQEVLSSKEHIQKTIKKIQSEIQLRNNQKEKINDIIKILDDDERELINLRYFSKPVQRWKSVAQNLNQTSDNCIKRRRKIIKKITELL